MLQKSIIYKNSCQLQKLLQYLHLRFIISLPKKSTVYSDPLVQSEVVVCVYISVFMLLMSLTLVEDVILHMQVH